MSAGLLLFLITVGAVAFFALALSLTFLFKGHHIDSEIGENENMKKRGITCAAQQIRNEEAVLRGEPITNEGCGGSGCSSCTTGDCMDADQKDSDKYPV